MLQGVNGRTHRLGAWAAALALALPGAARAQGGDGFMFRQPSATVQFRMGYDARLGEGGLYDFTRQTFRGIGQRDFDAVSVGGEIALRASDRVDVAIGLDYAYRGVGSEYENYIGTDNLPITQRTEFRTVPLTLSARYYLADRGRSVGRFAWIPRRVVPYVGGGLGVTWYTFEQQGEFVNFDTLEIYQGWLRQKGEAFTAHALGGLEVTLVPNVFLTGEARLTTGTGAVDSFGDYGALADSIDLTGLRITTGLGVRF